MHSIIFFTYVYYLVTIKILIEETCLCYDVRTKTEHSIFHTTKIYYKCIQEHTILRVRRRSAIFIFKSDRGKSTIQVQLYVCEFTGWRCTWSIDHAPWNINKSEWKKKKLAFRGFSLDRYVQFGIWKDSCKVWRRHKSD